MRATLGYTVCLDVCLDMNPLCYMYSWYANMATFTALQVAHHVYEILERRKSWF
jgi:hypothetical protein